MQAHTYFCEDGVKEAQKGLMSANCKGKDSKQNEGMLC